jgi:hypothetical protein
VAEDYQAPLPESAQVIADVIGREATLHLAKHLRYDGLIYSKSRRCRLFYVPKLKRLTEAYWLVQVIGYENAKLLQDEFGGSLLTLAACSETLRGERNHRVVTAYKAGKSVQEIATLHAIAPRTVYDILFNTRNRTDQRNG